MKSRKVGCYANMSSTDVYIVNLKTVCTFTKEGAWKEKINTLPKDQLPCFTVSGVFKGAKAQDNLETNSNILSLDIDNFTNLDGVMGVLARIRPHIYSYFKSASGKGLCVLVAIDDFDGIDDFKQIYEAIYDEVRDLNEHSKFDYLPNLNRLRYVSYDPDLYINEEAVPYTKRKEIPYKIEVKEGAKLINIKLEVNKLQGKDRIEAIDKIYTGQSGNFGANGKPRHDWVLGLSRWLCRGDVDQQDALSYILTNYHNPDRGAVWTSEVGRCVRDSYRNYATERGTYVPTKPFDYRDITSATDLEQVRESFLAYIGKEEEYVEGLSDEKIKSFLRQKVVFLKTIYRWL